MKKMQRRDAYPFDNIEYQVHKQWTTGQKLKKKSVIQLYWDFNPLK